MLDYTIDVLLIGLVAVMLIGVIKAPIKALLVKKGLKENEKMAKIFKAIVTTVSFVSCFIGACIYFWFFKHTNPFTDASILWYTIGTVGASQTIYMLLETYGRDGVLMIIKAIIANRKNVTTTIVPPNTEELASKIATEIQSLYEGAPVTAEDIKSILDHIQ